jgi:hypothetical protein
MFDRIKTIFKGKDSLTQDAPPPPSPPESRSGWKLDDISKVESGRAVSEPKAPTRPAAPVTAPSPAHVAVPVPAPAPPPPKPKAPEELCGITPKMGKDEVRTTLAALYRRYNRASSSLDPKLRAEAEEMLDAIVAIREKVFGPI